MPDVLNIDYLMEGNINGVDIAHIGEGQANFETGVEEVRIKLSAVPNGWDPALLPLICSGPSRVGLVQGTAVPSLLSLGDWHYFTEPGKLRLGELYTIDGELVGKVAATGDYRRLDSTLQYRIKMRSDVHLKSPVAEISHYSYQLLPNGRGKVIAHSHFRVLTRSGETLYGFTTIPYGLSTNNELDRLIMGMQFIETEQNGLNFRYKTKTIRRFAPTETEESRRYFAALSDGLEAAAL